MRLACFCACGGALTGHVTPVGAATVLDDAFRSFHNGFGCAPTTREQAQNARRRAGRAGGEAR